MIKDDVKSNAIKPRPGRPKGSLNKLTNIKDEFLFAYEVIGGLGGLTVWAKQPENRTKFYEMITKLFPKEIKLESKVGKSVSELTIPELVEIITGKGTADTPPTGDRKPDNIH